ncbi:MAG TPA: aminodeoxychorismate synthase component I [Pirellulales bacterium]|nr:aminodeoxychorismate synthase component I [Pirellulales bacterium]
MESDSCIPRAVIFDSGAAVLELNPAPDAEAVFQCLAGLPHCLFLDSARRDPQLGRYSFLTADPFEFVTLPVLTECGTRNGGDAFVLLRDRLSRYAAASLAELPPFQGGAAGLFSYDLAHDLERLPRPRFDEFQAPAMAVGLYDVVVAFDHSSGRAWIISQGFPEVEPTRRRRRAVERLEQFARYLGTASNSSVSSVTSCANAARCESRPTLKTADLALQHSTNRQSDVLADRLTSSFSAEQYLAAVARAIEYIHAGDVFQVNLAQRLLHPATSDSVSLYLRLRRRNPATFGGYFDLGEFQIASASPERFLQVRDGEVEARPIKGTRRRTARPEADLFAGDELRESEKDNAENVMIVDLLRNDLSRVCRPESVVVSELCRLESYEFVQHLVSVVRGRLREGVGPLDLLRAAFPGGSVTGAPKIRAMEIIAELEPTARGPYCGALGYIGFDGTMDTNILIRTITAGRGWWQMPVGGGIVAQSDPRAEYEETWHKAEGLLRALD